MRSQKNNRMLAGTLAGWSMVTVGQPLDYLKTMYQVKQKEILSLKQIYKNIGFRGFYKGASSIYLFVGVVTALEFQTFQRINQMFSHFGLQSTQQPKTYLLMIGGSATGIASSFIYTPTEYAKILCQVQHKPIQGSAAMIFKVLYHEGLRGLRTLYTGHTITLAKQSIGSALYYGGYYVTLTKIFNQPRDEALLFFQILSGSVAGIIYQLYAYPFDTIKTNVQSGKKSFKEMINARFWKLRSFRMGFYLAVVRSIMVDAINFSVYENLRRVFCFHSSSNRKMW